VLFDESGIGAGPQYLVYVHRLDNGSTVRLGPGRAMAFSPDGRFVLILGTEDRTQFRLLPLEDGKAVELPRTGLEYQWARFFPDGQRLIALANEPGRPLRLYVQPLRGKPFPITPPTVARNVAISPDGNDVAVLSANGQLAIYPVAEGGTARVVPTNEALAPLLWTQDERSAGASLVRETPGSPSLQAPQGGGSASASAAHAAAGPHANAKMSAAARAGVDSAPLRANIGTRGVNPEGWLYVQHLGAYTQIPTRISRLDLHTGRLQAWQEVAPADRLGVNAITKVMLSADAGTVVFNYRRVLSELFVAEPSPAR
jgi:hypothetical protein